MPIKFRCPHCEQFLGISRTQAGMVTDCPMCGRTIRVPDLDGTLRPLPSPELNLADPGLANALDKLAGLHLPEPETPQEGPAVSMLDSESAPARLPKPLPEPIEVSPAPAPRIVEAAHPHIPAAPAPMAKGPEVDLRSVLQELDGSAEYGGSDRPAKGARRSRGHVSPAWWALAAVSAAVLFGAGFAAGRWGMSVPEANPSTVAATPDAPQPAAAAPHVPARQSALTGRITYISDSGDSLPDSGARVLVLPQQREGSTLLPAAGVRAALASRDFQVAQAAIRALGGDLAVADGDGHYDVQLVEPGTYFVLMVSHYQPRGNAAPLDPATNDVLAKFFERPVQVAGETACHLSEFRYRGGASSPRDHAFDRT